jgi:hypothetical protein
MLLVYMDCPEPYLIPFDNEEPEKAITFILARPESWQIVGKWLFEQQSRNWKN